MFYKMIAKIYISFLITVLVSFYSYGQDYNKYCLYTDYAVKAYEKGKYEQAISLMDSAINQCKEQNNDAANWYNLAFFYKALYKQDSKLSTREKMLSTILHAQKLDDKNELNRQITSYLKSIANYYKNDGIKILDDTSSNFSGAIEKYEKYKSIIRLIDSSIDFKNEDIIYYNNLAYRNNIKFENDKKNYMNHADSAILYYQKSLLVDSNQAHINEDIGRIYFNQAVDIINNLDPEADFEVAMNADQKKADLAMKGLPYFKKAFELDPSNSEIIYALAGCYDILNFKDESEFYLSMLKEKDPQYINKLNSGTN